MYDEWLAIRAALLKWADAMGGGRRIAFIIANFLVFANPIPSFDSSIIWLSKTLKRNACNLWSAIRAMPHLFLIFFGPLFVTCLLFRSASFIIPPPRIALGHRQPQLWISGHHAILVQIPSTSSWEKSGSERNSILKSQRFSDPAVGVLFLKGWGWSQIRGQRIIS